MNDESEAIKGGTAQALLELQQKLISFTSGQDVLSGFLNSIYREIRGTPVEYYISEVLARAHEPSIMLASAAELTKARGGLKRRLTSKKKLDRAARLQKVRPLQLLIEQMTRLTTSLVEGGDYDSVVKLLKGLRTYYEQIAEKFLAQGRAALLADEVDRISVQGKGTYTLKSGIGESIAPLDASGALKRTNARGVHKVSNVGGVHFKFSELGEDEDETMADLGSLAPSNPGIEYAVDSLNKLLSSMDSSPPTSLVTVSRQGKRFIAMASQTVAGESLEGLLMGEVRARDLVGVGGMGEEEAKQAMEDLEQRFYVIDGVPLWARIPVHEEGKAVQLDGTPSETRAAALTDFFRELARACERNFALIDPHNYSVMCVLSMLTNPSDAKLDNYIAVRTGEPGDKASPFYMVSIDNDDSFIDGLLSLSTGHMIGCRSLLFAFSQMMQPVEPGFHRQLCECQPEIIVQNWLSELASQNRTYERLVKQNILTPQELEQLNLPIKLVPDTALTILAKLRRIRATALEYRARGGRASHMDLLEAADPLVAVYYRRLLARTAEQPDQVLRISAMFDNLFGPRTPMIEDLLAPEEQREGPLADLLKGVPRFRDYVRDRTQSPVDAMSALMSAPDTFVDMPTQVQAEMLESLLNEPVESLHLHHCEAINDNLLLALMQTGGKNMRRLTLERCHNVTDRSVYKIAVEGIKPGKMQLVIVECDGITSRCRAEVERRDPTISITLSTRGMIKKSVAMSNAVAAFSRLATLNNENNNNNSSDRKDEEEEEKKTELEEEVPSEEKKKKKKKDKKDKKKKKKEKNDDDDAAASPKAAAAAADELDAEANAEAQAAATHATAAATTATAATVDDAVVPAAGIDDDDEEEEFVEDEPDWGIEWGAGEDENDGPSLPKDAFPEDVELFELEKQENERQLVEDRFTHQRQGIEEDLAKCQEDQGALHARYNELTLLLSQATAHTRELEVKKLQVQLELASTTPSGAELNKQGSKPLIGADGKPITGGRVRALAKYYESGEAFGAPEGGWEALGAMADRARSKNQQAKKKRAAGGAGAGAVKARLAAAKADFDVAKEDEERLRQGFEAFSTGFEEEVERIAMEESELRMRLSALAVEGLEVEMARQAALKKREELLGRKRERLAEEERRLRELREKMELERRELEEERKRVEQEREKLRAREAELERMLRDNEGKESAEMLAMREEVEKMRVATQKKEEEERQRRQAMQAETDRLEGEFEAMRKQQRRLAEREEQLKSAKPEVVVKVKSDPADLRKMRQLEKQLEVARDEADELERARDTYSREKATAEMALADTRQEVQRLLRLLDDAQTRARQAVERQRKSEETQAILARERTSSLQKMSSSMSTINEASVAIATDKKKGGGGGGDPDDSDEDDEEIDIADGAVSVEEMRMLVAKLKEFGRPGEASGGSGKVGKLSRKGTVGLRSGSELKSAIELSEKDKKRIDEAIGIMKLDSLRVRTEACAALWRMTIGSNAAKEEMGRAGAVELILSLMEKHKADARFLRRAHGIIFQLVKVEENRLRMIQAKGGVTTFVDSIREHPRDANILKQAVRTMYFIVTSGKDGVKALKKARAEKLLEKIDKSLLDEQVITWLEKVKTSLNKK